MIISDSAILEAMQKGDIVIKPFDTMCLGSNSYDVHLGSHLAIYKDGCLDAAKHNEVTTFEIPEEGFVLQPNILYLGVTLEYTETHKHVPFLEGKSSTGRLGISIHATAGKGDVGFCNYWTLEIFVTQRVRVYAGMPIGQLIYHTVDGQTMLKYNQKKDAKYTAISDKPMESAMYKNAFFNGIRKGKNRALCNVLSRDFCTNKYAQSFYFLKFRNKSNYRRGKFKAMKKACEIRPCVLILKPKPFLKNLINNHIFSPFKKYR